MCAADLCPECACVNLGPSPVLTPGRTQTRRWRPHLRRAGYIRAVASPSRERQMASVDGLAPGRRANARPALSAELPPSHLGRRREGDRGRCDRHPREGRLERARRIGGSLSDKVDDGGLAHCLGDVACGRPWPWAQNTGWAMKACRSKRELTWAHMDCCQGHLKSGGLLLPTLLALGFRFLHLSSMLRVGVESCAHLRPSHTPLGCWVGVPLCLRLSRWRSLRLKAVACAGSRLCTAQVPLFDHPLGLGGSARS